MSQYHFTPDGYLEMIRAEVLAYDELQVQVAAAASGMTDVREVLELGTGTGQTSLPILESYPDAQLVGIDVSEEMLDRARDFLPNERVRVLIVQDIGDPLPFGPFDLVVSALAVHHLKGDGKAALFRRVAKILRPRGRFVMGDVVVPDDPRDAVTPLGEDYDFPSDVADMLEWLSEAGFSSQLTWAHKDLAVIRADVVP